MARQINDQLYIDLGYLTPEDYYTYQAEALSDQTAETTITCDASVIAGGVAVFGSGDLPSFAALTCTISHINGADLFAFSEATLAAQAEVIRETNIELSTQFDVAVSAVRGIYVSAQADSYIDVFSAGVRSAGLEAAIDAAFSLNVDYEKVIETSGNLESNSQVFVDLVAILDFASIQSTNSELSAIISHIEGADLVAFAEAELIAVAELISNTTVEIFANTTQSVESNRLRDNNLVVESLTTLDIQIVRIKSTTTEFNVSSILTASVGEIAIGSTSLQSEFNLQATARTTKSLVSNVNIVGTISAVGLRNRPKLITPVGSPIFSTNNKFGGYSVKFPGTVNQQPANYLKISPANDFINWSTLDFWVYIEPTAGTFGGIAPIISYRGSGSNTTRWELFFNGVNHGSGTLGGYLQYNDYTGASKTYANNRIANATWTHIHVTKSISNISVWINGIQVTTSSSFGTVATSYPNGGELHLGRWDGVFYHTTYLDELLMSSAVIPGGTVPTTAYKNINQDNVQMLLHFDSNYVDDTNETLPVIINLSSNFAVTSSIKAVKASSANIISTASLSATSLRIKSASTNFSSISTTMAVVAKRLGTAIDLDVTSTQVTNAVRRAGGKSNISSQSQLVAQVTKTEQLSTNLNSQCSLTAIGYKIKASEANIVARATQSSSYNIIASASADIGADTNLEIDVSIIKASVIIEAGEFKLESNLTANKNSNIAIVINSTLTSAATSSTDFTADLVVNAFTLVVAKEFNLEFGAVYIIPAENRLWVVPFENREFVIENENRTFNIQGI